MEGLDSNQRNERFRISCLTRLGYLPVKLYIMPELIALTCPTCNQQFRRQRRHLKYETNAGRTVFTCSSCSALAKRNGKEVPCVYCGALTYKSKRSLSRFPNHYCSRSCSVAQRNTVRIGPLHPNFAHGKYSYKRHLQESCEECGETRKFLLHVHHKNADHSNHLQENCETVCLNCHATRHLVFRNGSIIIDYRHLTSPEVQAMVRAAGFQPATSPSQAERSKQTELRPDDLLAGTGRFERPRSGLESDSLTIGNAPA